MRYHDIQQGSDEWFDLRAGLVTSSKIACIMAHFGKPFGDPAKKLAQRIALERFMGTRIEEDSYQNAAMKRGNELEPYAREAYEMDQMVSVKNGGFWEDGKRGDSPDGLVGNYGVIEIKSVYPDAHWKCLKEGGFDTSYQWQIHNHIWVTDRKWCDFISYCPEFPEDKRLYVHRVHRDDDAIAKMTIRLAQFEELVEQNILLLQS